MAFSSSYTTGLLQQSEFYYGTPDVSLSGSFSGSFTGDGSNLINVSLPSGVLSSSAQIASDISGSLNSATASFAITGSFVEFSSVQATQLTATSRVNTDAFRVVVDDEFTFIGGGINVGGNVTSSGTISSSGQGIFDGVLVTDANYDAEGTAKYRVDGYSVLQNSGTTLNIAGNNYWETITYGNEDTDKHSFVGQITASGTISGSAFVGDGSQLSGITIFPFTGSAIMTGSLAVSASSHIELAIQTGSSAASFETTKVFGEQILSNNNADFTFFEDQYIKMSIDESANDVDVEVLQNPSSGRVHFFSMCSDGTDAAVDGLTSTTPTILETNLGNDTQALISVNAPDDTTWPIYKFDVIRTNSTYYTKRYIVHIKKMQNPYS